MLFSKSSLLVLGFATSAFAAELRGAQNQRTLLSNCVDCPNESAGHCLQSNGVCWPSLDGVTCPYYAPTPCIERSAEPSVSPSVSPSASPSDTPSEHPSVSPSDTPSENPSDSPSDTPSEHPSASPSANPSQSPSATPSERPPSCNCPLGSAGHCLQSNGVCWPNVNGVCPYYAPTICV
jgi:hypothetical protein